MFIVLNSNSGTFNLVGICEYFSLGRGLPCTNESLALLFSGRNELETGLLQNVESLTFGFSETSLTFEIRRIIIHVMKLIMRKHTIMIYQDASTYILKGI